MSQLETKTLTVTTNCYTSKGIEEVQANIVISVGNVLAGVEKLEYVFNDKAQEQRRRELLQAHPMYKNQVDQLMKKAIIEDQLLHIYNDMTKINKVLTDNHDTMMNTDLRLTILETFTMQIGTKIKEIERKLGLNLEDDKEDTSSEDD